MCVDGGQWEIPVKFSGWGEWGARSRIHRRAQSQVEYPFPPCRDSRSRSQHLASAGRGGSSAFGLGPFKAQGGRSHPLRFSESPAIVPARSFPIAESGADHSFPIVPTYPFPTPSLLVPTLPANSPSPPRQPPPSLEPAVAAGAAVDRGGADGAAGGMTAAGSLTAGGFRPGGDADEVGSECAASSVPGEREHTLSFTAGLGGRGGGRERVTGLGGKV